MVNECARYSSVGRLWEEQQEKHGDGYIPASRILLRLTIVVDYSDVTSNFARLQEVLNDLLCILQCRELLLLDSTSPSG